MNLDFSNLFIMFPIFLFALTIHEIAHALTANWGGDLTATYQNRLSLNPVVHIDPVGTILMPVIASLTGIPFFGWAKPVPVMESNFRRRAWQVIVSLAGPFSNFLQVLFGTLLLSFVVRSIIVGESWGWWTISDDFALILMKFAFFFVTINWLLCFFNLIPVPPLHGSHVLYEFAIRGRGHLYAFWDNYSRIGLFVLFGLFWVSPLGGFLGSLVFGITRLTLYLLGFPVAELGFRL